MFGRYLDCTTLVYQCSKKKKKNNAIFSYVLTSGGGELFQALPTSNNQYF